ncbi:O-acyltransferase [Fasciola gigantica]|uniref:O-acyltransferase n=1 Tax=Fasciola gigantica TaxID=46835 RepID=A0A504YRG7_FASGI|nr:O-acyltransferase [Fasciola gigantica]
MVSTKMKTARALSVANLSDYEKVEAFYYENSPDKPIHRPNQSLLTTTSGFTNFRGLLNWGAFLLLITTGRMALENVLKYGIVINPSSWLLFILQSHGKYFALILLLCTNLFICAAWLMEQAVVRGKIGNRTAMFFCWWNLICVLALPTATIVSHDFNPLFSAPVLSVYTILFLKLWSYGDVNRWCRKARSEENDVFVAKTPESRKRESTPSRPSASVSSVTPSSGEQMNNGSGAGDTSTTASTATLKVSHKKPQGEEVTWDQTLRKRKEEFTKSPPIGNRRSASPNPQGRQRCLSSDVERTRPARYSIASAEQYDNLLDAIDHELHSSIFSGEMNDLGARRYIAYPQNVTLSNLYYFIFAPTLCYELNFPRTLFIRKSFLFRRLFEVIFLSQLILCFSQQWMIPTLKNSVTPIAESNFSQILERCLKLAIPNHLIWLIMFYSLFHSLFNLIGELMYFADRFFYSDWWNAETVPAFWSKWNIPVHRFARR